ALAIDGGIAVAGMSAGRAGQGSALVFGRDEGGSNNWGEIQRLLAADSFPSTPDEFGTSVAVSGELIVVGAPASHTGDHLGGAVRVFARNSGGANRWGETSEHR